MNGLHSTGWRNTLLKAAESHETPFFVLSRKRLQESMESFGRAVKSVFPGAKTCFSVKTNPHPSVLKEVSRQGFGFEVASARELDLVRGFKAFKVFNGPCKTDKEVREALHQNAFIVLDSFSDLELVARVFGTHPPKSLDVGLRLNVGGKKFGFSLDQLALARAQCHEKGLNPVLLHVHPGTQESLEKYGAFLNDVVRVLEQDGDWKFIDFGGGFPDATALQESRHTLKEYVDLIQDRVGFLLKDKTAVFEPGRCMVSHSMALLCKVRHVKELNGIRFAVLDAGINVLQRSTLNRFQYRVLNESKGKKALVKLAGPTLMGFDELTTITAHINPKDWVVVENVGAYCTSMSWTLSYPLPKIVEVD